MRTITISAQFCGPPTSANGGIVGGLLAQELHEVLAGDRGPNFGAVEVTLKAPPPLDVALSVESSDDHVVLRHDDLVVAVARGVDAFEVSAPPDLSYGQVEAIAASSPVLRAGDEHPFPSCFVCGPARPVGDGLRIFAAQIPGGVAFVAPFRPTSEQLGAEFAWAAMDCPSGFPMYLDTDVLPGPYVLGRMTAQIEGVLEADQNYVVAAWRDEVSGRKLSTSVVLYEPATPRRGIVAIAHARSVWIRL